jgi:GAF domain-containing protein
VTKLSQTLLSPVIAVWRWSLKVRLRDIPRPSDNTHAQALGPDALWVLVVGNDIATGWGVRTHDLGVPGQLARELTRVSGRGTEIDVAIAEDSAAIAQFATSPTGARYDAIVVVGGVRDALRLRSVAKWRAEMSRTLEALVSENGTHTHIVVMGIRRVNFVSRVDMWLTSIVAEHALKLNAITMELCATLPRVSYLDLPELAAAARPGEHRAAMNYRLDAEAITAHLLPLLDAENGAVSNSSARERTNEIPQNVLEAARQSAVDALPPFEDELGEEIDGLVAAAKAVYDTTFASFTIVDGDRLDYRVVAGGKPSSVPRNESVCTIAMHSDGPTIVADTARDARFRHLRGIRFYAGVPVMSEAGHRIGMLCVVDSEPRDPSTFDTTMLSELAKLLQKRLWAQK